MKREERKISRWKERALFNINTPEQNLKECIIGIARLEQIVDQQSPIWQIKSHIKVLENKLSAIKEPVSRDLAITDFLKSILQETNQVTAFDYSLQMDTGH